MQMVFPTIHKEVRVKEEEMARFSCLSSAFLLLLAFAFVAEIICGANAVAYQPTGGEGSVPTKECPSKCAYRCSETSHKKPCMFFCIKCCTKCLCVPSGTYGHKEECPCYNNWKTKEGKSKCP